MPSPMAATPGSYGVRRAAISNHISMPITEVEFLAIEKAQSVLRDAVDLEEKFNVIMGNFRSFEKFLLGKTLDIEIWPDFDHSNLQDIRTEANRKLLNLLSSCRLYQDSKETHLKAIFPQSSDVAEEAKRFSSRLYDTSFSYRFVEALRNHVQHRAFGATGFTIGGSWIEPKDESGLPLRRRGIGLNVSLVELKEGGAFKRAVLQEAEKLDPVPDLKLLIREYVDGIRKLHAFIREKISDVTLRADELIAKTITTYDALDKTSTSIGTCVVKYGKNGTYQIVSRLFLDGISYRAKLVKRNRTAGQLAQMYVSSEVLSR